MIVKVIITREARIAIMASVKEIQSRNITSQIKASIQKVLDSPELADLSQDQIEAIAKYYYISSLKNEFSKEVERAKLDDKAVCSYINQWLSGFKSEHTIRSFRKNLTVFLEWLNDDTSIIDVNALVADKYMTFINSHKNLSENTKRQRIAACSSFFNDLVRWEVVDKNPFKKMKGLPKKKIAIKEADKIPSNYELDLIEQYALNQIKKARSSENWLNNTALIKMENGNINAYCALIMLRKYGFRVGALNTLRIDKNGNYTAISKGNEISGHFDYGILSMLKDFDLSPKTPFENYSGNAFSMWLWRAQSSKALREKLNIKYSAHSIRHRFAIDFYKERKDIHQLQKMLAHSSLLVTTAYLAGLKNY